MPDFRWIALAVTVALGTVSAQPPLTTIQDTLYKADGTRFDGFAFIEWKSFDASNGASIPMQSIVVRVAGGDLRVALAPTTNASNGAHYQVKFNSDGKIQFTEYWSVPPSASPLALRDVRLAGAPGSMTAGGTSGASTSVGISDVTGLQQELNNRPMKGPGFINGRVAVINPAGTVDGAAGNVTDCLRVDGTSVACVGGGGPGFSDNEVPAGDINGTNTVFTLANTPSPANSLVVYKNGLLQRLSVDYALATNIITFAPTAIPKTGDLLTVSYRLPTPATVAGAAGGHLSGYYPNPQIAGGVISDINIAGSAAISESKLALAYPTHANTNDPTVHEKAALAGTSGFPGPSNRFVTDSDPRNTNARTPTPHGLLNTEHGDTTPGSPVRGDVIVAQGSPGKWSRLPIGAANRCLMSNGSDAVWNTCLFTGFNQGAIPFVDGSGNLSQHSDAFVFDAPARRLSVGNNQSLATGYFWDSTDLTGITSLVVRAGSGQGVTALQRWVGADGQDLAWVNAEGGLRVKGFETRTTDQSAGFRDLGTAVDPVNKLNGDMWYNTAQQARKTVDAGQTHTQAQILCNSTGLFTTSNGLLGNCHIPAFFLDAGDRVEVHFNYQHTGTSSDWNFGIAFGPALLISKNVDKAETLVTGRSDGAIHGEGVVWGSQAYGTGVFTLTTTTGVAEAIPASAFNVGFYGAVLTPGTDTVKLLNFTVVRYPAISNPN